MISRDEFEGLMLLEVRPGSPVLSVYLDTDQSREINIERVREVGDLIDRVDARVLEMSGKVEEVFGDAAARLRGEGSIGALLLRW